MLYKDLSRQHSWDMSIQCILPEYVNLFVVIYVIAD